MGIPAYVVASSLVAVLAQRLVRRLCACKRQNPDGTASPQGCETCRFTGFKGRMGVYELMRLTPRVRSVLLARASDDVVRRAAQATGMRTMFDDRRRKAGGGLTVVDEPGSCHRTNPRWGRGAVRARAALHAAANAAPRILVVDDGAALLEVVEETLRGRATTDHRGQRSASAGRMPATSGPRGHRPADQVSTARAPGGSAGL
jgi:hypothetical protein